MNGREAQVIASIIKKALLTALLLTVGLALAVGGIDVSGVVNSIMTQIVTQVQGIHIGPVGTATPIVITLPH